MKGQGGAETAFIFTMVIIIVLGTWFTLQISPRYPQFQFITGFSALVMVGSFVGVAGACAIATGLPCAAALIAATGLTFFLTPNPLVSLLIFTPITVTLAYIISRLAKGGG